MNEKDSCNENGISENPGGCSTEHPTQASEVSDLKFPFWFALFTNPFTDIGTEIEQVDDSKQQRGDQVQEKVKHEKTSGGKTISSVLVKKKIDGKVVASNGSVGPKSLNGREAHVTKVTNFSVCS